MDVVRERVAALKLLFINSLLSVPVSAGVFTFGEENPTLDRFMENLGNALINESVQATLLPAAIASVSVFFGFLLRRKRVSEGLSLAVSEVLGEDALKEAIRDYSARVGADNALLLLQEVLEGMVRRGEVDPEAIKVWLEKLQKQELMDETTSLSP